MLGRQVVRASSQVVLDQDAVASNHVALRVLLSEHHLSAEVRSLNHDVLFTQHEVVVELHAERALEHRVGEDAPLGVGSDAGEAFSGSSFQNRRCRLRQRCSWLQ